ncbi:MAG: hypothetical protein H7039_04500, partial [Bryobacteraceae bacterium]|nr:hypothetical protein [Bryobacteraceae bacterium]
MDLLNLFRHRRETPPVSLRDIRDSFNAAASDEDHFPSTIDPRIFHV